MYFSIVTISLSINVEPLESNDKVLDMFVSINSEFILNRDLKLDNNPNWIVKDGLNNILYVYPVLSSNVEWIDVNEKTNKSFLLCKLKILPVIPYIGLGISDSNFTWNSYNKTKNETVAEYELIGNIGLFLVLGLESIPFSLPFGSEINMQCGYSNHKNNYQWIANYRSFLGRVELTSDVEGSYIEGITSSYFLGFTISKKIKRFTPYGGINYTVVQTEWRGKNKNENSGDSDVLFVLIDNVTFKPIQNFVIFAGSTVEFPSSIYLNLRIKLLNQTAINLEISKKF